MDAIDNASKATQVTAEEVKKYRDEHQITMKEAKEAVKKEKQENFIDCPNKIES